jgi:ubiquitin-protein ligase
MCSCAIRSTREKAQFLAKEARVKDTKNQIKKVMTSVKRVLKDLQNVRDLSGQNIWYYSDDHSAYSGTALIQGPDGTPYEGCLFAFAVKFPNDYPFSPPSVRFLTGDGRTRLHPNLYVEGKVCLSILGTYPGPSWSGTQTLSSVLLSILALLDANPLAHEPSFEKGTLLDPRHKEYADAVEHNCIKLMIESLQSFQRDPEHHLWSPFLEIVEDKVDELKEKLRRKILEKAQGPERIWPSLPYGMSVRSYWKQLSLTATV